MTRNSGFPVATSPAEVPRLVALRDRAQENGVPVEWLDGEAARKLEPEVEATAALWSPESGIVDSHELMLCLQADLEAAGGLVAFRSRAERLVRDATGAWQIDCAGGDALAGRQVVNASGLGAQTLARATDGMSAELVPPLNLMKGHYFMLSGRSPFRHLVYPLPGAHSLGIHATHDLAGLARFGPDAVPVETVDYGFEAGREVEFAEAIARYWPGLDPERLQPAYTGIRAQLALGPEGRRDFVLSGPAEHGLHGLWHMFGFESPGLTAALAVGEWVAGRVAEGR